MAQFKTLPNAWNNLKDTFDLQAQQSLPFPLALM